MHIIAGERRNAQLIAPKGLDTRPTQAKVKESLFNILQGYVPESHVLDLFAGSGNLALEALSRGASFAVLVDKDREAAQCISKNINKLRYEDKAKLFKCEWLSAVEQLVREKHPPFDLVFLDPPYRMEILAEICAILADRGLLARDAILVLEHRTGVFQVPDERFRLWKDRVYADTTIHFFMYQPDEEKQEQ